MASTTRIAEVLDAITDELAKRPALDGVLVASADLGKELVGNEWIAFDGDHLMDGDWSALGQLSREETITLRGVVYVTRPGGGETTVREARRRAAELFGAIEAFVVESAATNRLILDDGVARVNTTKIRPVGYADGITTSGRHAGLAFELECFTRLVRS